MKKIIFLLIATLNYSLTLVAQNSRETNPFNAKDSIQISGQIFGYNPSQADHFITFSTYDLFGRQNNQAIQIEDNGSFWIKLYQEYDGDIQFNYKNAYQSLYAKAGIPIILEIYDDKLTETSNFDHAFSVKGQLAEVNNLIFKFSTALSKQKFPYADYDKMLTDSLFAVKSLQNLQQKQSFLNKFITEHQVKNQLFIDWQSNQFQYTAGQEILFFPFLGKLNTQISQKQLLALLKSIPINNVSAFHNSAYYHFLSSICGDQQIIININPAYEKIKKELVGNTVGLSLDLVDSYAIGLTKQLLYYINYHRRGSYAANPIAFSARFDQVITNPYLSMSIKSNKDERKLTFETYNVVDRLKKLKANPALKKKLIDLFSTYKGTNLYVDFWGDWCGPCMSELPHYPKLIETLAGKPIKFLFLSTFTTEESMLAIKQKFKIKGDFVNLTKDEVAIVNNVFEFHSYPSHFLINGKGEAIQKMSKTSNDGIQQKAQEIAQLLNR